MNKVVTIAAAKGGVTKTTSSMYLAASAVRKDPEARVRVMATDPQFCAARWALEAEESGAPPPLRGGERETAGCGAAGRRRVRGPDHHRHSPCRPDHGGCGRGGRLRGGAPHRHGVRSAAGVEHPQGSSLLCRVEPHTRLFKAVSDALAAQQTPRFDAVIRKRQAIKACMGADPGKLYEYAEAYGELEELLEGVSA